MGPELAFLVASGNRMVRVIPGVVLVASGSEVCAEEPVWDLPPAMPQPQS